MSMVASRKGFVIVKIEKGKHCIVQPFKHENESTYKFISGYGEIFLRRIDAEQISHDLNESWDDAQFYVAKAELRLTK